MTGIISTVCFSASAISSYDVARAKLEMRVEEASNRVYDCEAEINEFEKARVYYVECQMNEIDEYNRCVEAGDTEGAENAMAMINVYGNDIKKLDAELNKLRMNLHYLNAELEKAEEDLRLFNEYYSMANA